MTSDPSPQRLAIVAALPREILTLVRALDRNVQAPAGLQRDGIHVFEFPQVVVVAAGMGAARVSLAVRAALRAQPGTTELVSVGLAGSCNRRLKPGAVVEPGMAIEVLTGERLRPATGQEPVILATTDTIAGIREKQRLAMTYSASVVDMEAATIGRLARAHGLRFSMVKGISDGPQFEMANLSRFADARGHFRTAAFALHTALRPGTWAHAMELGRNSQRALEALTQRLLERIAAEHQRLSDPVRRRPGAVSDADKR